MLTNRCISLSSMNMSDLFSFPHLANKMSPDENTKVMVVNMIKNKIKNEFKASNCGNIQKV